ncbi:hypothetical protein GCM10023081_46710 [Arthrobacter ginkgonis]|uniref:Gp28/Gp37-like domain-containing protein n=1 Tax=Arthrobacter ginkgonis TaxID=1630594 RepID=A0ABP7DK74_9MICC
MNQSPWQLRIYDKALGFKGFVGDAEVSAKPCFNDTPTLTIKLDADHYAAPKLAAAGARVVAYRHGRAVMSGPVKLQSVAGLAEGGVLTFTLEGDFRLLKNILAFPVADHTVTGATVNDQDVEYRSITAPAETVVKTIIAENLARIGGAFAAKFQIATDEGRGATIKSTFRMHAPYDRLFPAVEQAGLGVSVLQVGDKIVIDVYEPRVYPHVLSVENGTLADGSGTLSIPTLTRAVVGGQGEGTARTFKQYKDAAREAEYGDIIEQLVDARDSSSGDVYAERAAEALAEGAPKAGFSLTLLESDSFTYGPDGVLEGDLVTVKIGALEVTDIIREVPLTWDKDGDTATPTVGDHPENPARRLINMVRKLATGEKDRKAR